MPHVFAIVVVLASVLQIDAANPSTKPARKNDGAIAEGTFVDPLIKNLGLVAAENTGGRIWYDPALNGDKERTGEHYRELLNLLENPAGKSLLKNADSIIGDINRIVGVSANEQTRQKQRNMLAFFSGPQIPQETATCFVGRDRLKELVKAGQTLPGFTYDKSTERVTYHFNLNRSTRNSHQPPPSVFFPVDEAESEHDLEEAAAQFTEIVRMMDTTGVAVHEVVEMAIVQRLRPRDPYFRWFSDGFANAITAHVIRDHLGDSVANAFLADFDAAKYADIQKDVNLQYWLGLQYCIKTPLESENRLTHARYAYATLEARRLIDQYGIDKVKIILNKAAPDPKSNDSRNLFSTIRDVTGKDMEQRLSERYQNFSSREEGLARYSTAYNDAVKRNDFPAALANLMRVRELRQGYSPLDYVIAAELLVKMRDEAAADEVFEQAIAFFRERQDVLESKRMQERFIEHCLKNGPSEKGLSLADALLKETPDFIPALALRMKYHRDRFESDQAEKLANHILELDKTPGSPYRRLAEQIKPKSETSNTTAPDRFGL